MATNDYYNLNGCLIEQILDIAGLEKDGLLNTTLGNPCQNHPSDHYSLVYKVQLLRPNE